MPYSSYSNKSGIGGILKGLGLKGKSNSSKFNDSDSDLQISSEHTNREYKSRTTFPTAAAMQKNNKKPPNRAGKFIILIGWCCHLSFALSVHMICSFLFPTKFPSLYFSSLFSFSSPCSIMGCRFSRRIKH